MIPAKFENNRDLIRAGALLVNSLAKIDEAAALTGMTVAAFIEALEDPATQSLIETESAQMRASGKLTETRALVMLDRLLVTIESQLDGLTPSSATRVAEILLRISGISERRAAEIRQVSPQDGARFSITINLGGDRQPVCIGGNTVESEAVEVIE